MGVALWVRVLLPQLLGSNVPAVSSPAAAPPSRLGREPADRVLAFLDAALATERPTVELPELDERGNVKWHPGTVGARIPEGPLVRQACIPVFHLCPSNSCSACPRMHESFHAHACLQAQLRA